MFTSPYSPFLARFFRAKRAGPARLGPLRAGLGQEIEPACLDGPDRAQNGLGFTGPGGPFGHLYVWALKPRPPRRH
jgi:hypothetical protein